jgi:HlyD family secretion protein
MKNDFSLEALPMVNSDEFLTPVSIWTKLTGIFLLVTVGSLVALSSTVRYNVTVKANAYVRPKGELRVIQSTADGPIDKIEIQEIQYVTAEICPLA